MLRVENCADHYVQVRCDYRPSCFGRSLDELVRPLDAASEPLAVPPQLWRLADALRAGGGLREKDLFSPGACDPQQVAAIRLALDTAQDLPPCTAPALAGALLGLIAALPSPLLPVALYPQVGDARPAPPLTAAQAPLDGGSVRAYSRRLLEALPAVNYNVLIYTLSLMREVLAQREANRWVPPPPPPHRPQLLRRPAVAGVRRLHGAQRGRGRRRRPRRPPRALQRPAAAPAAGTASPAHRHQPVTPDPSLRSARREAVIHVCIVERK